MGKVTDGTSPEKLNAIFHHPDCRKVFNAKCEAIRLPESNEMHILHDAISECKPAFSFDDLNFTKDEFAGFMTKPLWELHTGITIRVIKLLRSMRIGNYMGKYKAEKVIGAGFDIEEQLQSIVKPIKDEVIDEFWEKATIIQMNEVNRVANEAEKRMKQGNLLQA